MLLSAGAPTARPQAAKLRPNRPGRASAGGPAPCRAAKTFVDHTSQLTDTTELKVEVFAQPDEVSIKLCELVEQAAAEAIKERGTFALAVPGGSVLKMLSPLAGRKNLDWSKIHMWYVNHKTVANDDALATALKAKNSFLNAVSAKPDQVYCLTGTDNPGFEAQAYELTLRTAMDKNIIPKDKHGLPAFDLMLLGMGSDGHVGSLYPNRAEVSATGKLVLPVDKGKPPASVTFSLPVMNAARHAVIAMTGANKAEAVHTALLEDKGAAGFPAQRVKPRRLTWLLDKGAASSLPALKGVSSLGV